MTTKSVPSTASSIQEKREDVGVIVGRFQTPVLHEGHKDLIDQVLLQHRKVVIFLGVSPNKRSRRNPLDFESRRLMIMQEYPNVVVLPLSDTRDDETWSANLDAKILEAYPFSTSRLYGSRDSFVSHYIGEHDTTEIEPKVFTSATSLRDQAGHDVKESAAWRAGVIYGAYNQYPKMWPTVDIAVIRTDEKGAKEVLMARKPNEDQWRFIGGFVDPTDESLEQAARREVHEESNVEVGELKYILSERIDDWRYRDDVDKIMTSFFEATYVGGHPQPQDDIEDLAWFAFDDGPRSYFHVKVVSAHKHLYRMLDYRAEREGWYAKSTSHKSAASFG